MMGIFGKYYNFWIMVIYFLRSSTATQSGEDGLLALVLLQLGWTENLKAC